MKTWTEWKQYLQGKSDIYIYGAGKVAGRLFRLLKRDGIEIRGFIISNRGENPYSIEDKPVKTKEELMKEKTDISSAVLVYSIRESYLSNMEFLSDLGFSQVLLLSRQCMDDMLRVDTVQLFCEQKKEYLLDTESSYLERGMAVIRNAQSCVPVFRVFINNNWNLILESLQEISMQRFTHQYGELQVLPCDNAEYVKEKNYTGKMLIERYVATSHLDQMQICDIPEESDWIPIQVGSALTSVRKGCVIDATGDNISLQNQNYCECTGLYWIWKNTKGQDYVGLEHYRRRLKLGEDTADYLVEKDVDVVLALPQFVMKRVYVFFVGGLVSDYDWRLMQKFILEYDETYRSILEEYDEAYFYFSCNLCLFKREWFDRYCDFAFSVSFNIEKVYEKKGVMRQDRYMGYIFENLLSIFMMKHYKEMNVVCTEVEWVE